MWGIIINLQSYLAAPARCVRSCQVQARPDSPPVSKQQGAALPCWQLHPRLRHLPPATARPHHRRWSACSAVNKYQPLGPTVYCWQPCLSGCCSSSLERSARGRHLIVIIAVFPASTKDYRIHIWFSDCLSGIVTVVLVVTLLFRPL